MDCEIIGKVNRYIKDTVVILSIQPSQEIDALRPYYIFCIHNSFYPIVTKQDNHCIYS